MTSKRRRLKTECIAERQHCLISNALEPIWMLWKSVLSRVICSMLKLKLSSICWIFKQTLQEKIINSIDSLLTDEMQRIPLTSNIERSIAKACLTIPLWSDWCITRMADFSSYRFLGRTLFSCIQCTIIPMMNFCDRHLSITVCCFLYNFSQESRFLFLQRKQTNNRKCFDTKASNFTNSNSIHTDVILQR